MNPQLKIVVVGFALVLILLLRRLIARGRIRPEYSLIWLTGLALAALLVAFDQLVFKLCSWLGEGINPFALLALAMLLFLAATCLHLSVRVSLLRDQSCVLDQKVALLEEALSRRAVDERRPPT